MQCFKEKIADRLDPTGRTVLVADQASSASTRDTSIQAQSWDKPRPGDSPRSNGIRRAVPQSRFIVTNMPMDPDGWCASTTSVGTAEQHIKEGKYRLPLGRGIVPEVSRQTRCGCNWHALAYNLAPS